MIKNLKIYWMWLIVLLATSNVSVADDITASLVKGGTPHQALFGVTLHESNGFAVGAGGRIFRTEDGGKNWVLEVNDNALSLLGVSFSGLSAVAVGQFGVIVVRDGEGNWRKVESGTSERIFNVDMNSKGQAVAVGAFGLILSSTDGGITWKDVSPDWSDTFYDPDMRLGGLFEPNVYGVQINDAGKVWVAGELSLVMISEDIGETWLVKNAGGSSENGVSSTLSAIDVRDDGTAFAVGQEGYVLKSQDHGDTWAKIKPATHQNLLGVSSINSGLVVAPGMREILLSYDDGESWTSVKGLDVDTGWYGSVAISSNAEDVIVVGNNSNIIKINYKR
jgi:photosystem II stability/assembly factor-like uncharacterized protein